TREELCWPSGRILPREVVDRQGSATVLGDAYCHSSRHMVRGGIPMRLTGDARVLAAAVSFSDELVGQGAYRRMCGESEGSMSSTKSGTSRTSVRPERTISAFVYGIT